MLLLACALVISAGCKKKEPPPAPEPFSTDALVHRRLPVQSQRLPRLGLSHFYGAAKALVADAVPIPSSARASQDDPELTDDYYGGEAEHDGGEVVAPPPRPAAGKLPGDRSFSIGPPNGGWLINGKALPLDGHYHRVLPGTQKRGWYWGSDDLVRLIQQAAAEVARVKPGAVLRVGNLSRKEGGKITPSVSHQSGRDADIGLYATDLDGNAVDPPGFPRFRDSKVDTTGRYLFDVARNWAFVAALLSDERASIQWVFLDTPLKYLLLDHAARMQVDPKLMRRAEKVIVRPRDSSPHANHFHIRIFCSTGDTEFGCRDYGPQWKWVQDSRKLEEQVITDKVDRIMRGEEPLNLDREAVSAPDLPTAAPTSPDQLRDPPTDVQIRL